MSDQHLEHLLEVKSQLSTVIANQENHKELLLNVSERQAKQSVRISHIEAKFNKAEGAAKLITLLASLLAMATAWRTLSR